MTEQEHIKYKRWGRIQKATGLGLEETIQEYNRIIRACHDITEIDSRIDRFIKTGEI
jgi:hypothetical protein